MERFGFGRFEDLRTYEWGFLTPLPIGDIGICPQGTLLSVPYIWCVYVLLTHRPVAQVGLDLPLQSPLRNSSRETARN